MSTVDEVIDSLDYLLEEDDVPKSVVDKITTIKEALNGSEKVSLAVNRATNELEELSEDVNLPPFVKTQIWSIMSQLAALESELVKH